MMNTRNKIHTGSDVARVNTVREKYFVGMLLDKSATSMVIKKCQKAYKRELPIKKHVSQCTENITVRSKNLASCPNCSNSTSIKKVWKSTSEYVCQQLRAK